MSEWVTGPVLELKFRNKKQTKQKIKTKKSKKKKL